jgi:hypothetical protein
VRQQIEYTPVFDRPLHAEPHRLQER